MEISINKQEFETFLEVAKELDNFFNVILILYGSLGLYRIIGEHGKVNDIDVLISKEFVNARWNELIVFMKSLNFELKNEKEHEFIRGENTIAFAQDDDLINMAKIDPDSLKISKVKGVWFKELSAEQYLSLYSLMLRDNYRQEKRGESDKIKIKLIKDFLDDKT